LSTCKTDCDLTEFVNYLNKRKLSLDLEKVCNKVSFNWRFTILLILGILLIPPLIYFAFLCAKSKEENVEEYQLIDEKLI